MARPLAEVAVSWPGGRGALFRTSRHPLRCWQQGTCKVRGRAHEEELHPSTRHLQEKKQPPAPCPFCRPCRQHPCPPPPSGPGLTTVKGTRHPGQTWGPFTLRFCLSNSRVPPPFSPLHLSLSRTSRRAAPPLPPVWSLLCPR